MWVKRLFLAWMVLLIPLCLKADPLEPFGYVKQVTQNDGDTITTTQVTCACTTGCVGGATLLSASQTGTVIGSKTNRRRTFHNISGSEVFVGTATVANSLNGTGYRIDAATGTWPVFTTYNTAAYYCQTVGNSSSTVTVIQETNANQ